MVLKLLVASNVSEHRRLRIAQVSPLYEAVPPAGYGGTERVVSYLTEELVRRGHDVTLFASGDSCTAAHLVAPAQRALRLDPDCRDPLAHHVRMLSEVYRRADEFDLIHCHTDYLGLPLARAVRTPTLLTLHGRLDIPDLAPIYAAHREVPLISISDAQRRPLPDAAWMATVHHGVPPQLYPFSATAGDYLLFLGRLSPEKCPDLAIRVARRAGLRLRIAAKVDAVDRDYFRQRVEPLLDDPGVEFLGEVGGDDKAALIGGALALLFPIDWPEPFGLVMIEALACGTPVVTRPCGSVPEVIEDGVTGLIADSEDELVAAVQRVQELERGACRAEFDRRFSDAAMCDRYLAIYERVLAGERAGLRTPARRRAVAPTPLADLSQ
ncbi:MAG TPA: glycosyltransferase family 4 protein [Candidatus Dormibacteraeota bacterium]|nr:glycosyltransferase family 4 protein [Candidatus Dormibacteraeota bacterium]